MTRTQSVIVVLGGFLLIWEAWVRLAGVPTYFLPAPSAIFIEIVQDPLWYARHSAYTVGACLLGFFMALAVGILAAIGIVYSKVLENTLYTFLVSLNSIPKIALAPLFIIWMGTNLSSKVAISMLIALFAIVIDTVLGLRSVDPDVLDMTKSMRASPLQVLWKIRFPTALPAMFAGMKVAVSARTATRTSTTCATWPSRRRWCGSSTCSSRMRSPARPPTSTSSRSRTRCASATGSTASSTSKRRHPAGCRPP